MNSPCRGAWRPILLSTGGVMPSNRAWLAEEFPDKFPSAGAAHVWWQELNGRFPYKDTYRDSYHLNCELRTVEYRLAGQRGKASAALAYPRFSDADIVARLEAHHGKAVTLTLETPLPEAPAAQPEVAMPIESPLPVEPCPPAIGVEPMPQFIPVTPAPKPGEVPYLERCRFGSKDWLSVEMLGLRFFIDIHQPPVPGLVRAVAPA